MRADASPRAAYVVKRFPRFSETFIVNEILAHEAAGTAVEIFSLYPPNDTHFQDAISRVRAPVTYITAEGLRGADLWEAIDAAATCVPRIWHGLRLAHGCDGRVVYQACQLAQAIVRNGITHVHAHFATVSAEVARLAAAWTGVPYTVTAHAKDIYHESVNVERLRQVLETASTVITVSDFNARHLTAQVGVLPRRLARIYNGLDLERFSYSPPIDRPPRIVAVGRLVAKKGLGDLVRACALLRERGVRFQCELIGGGTEETGLRQIIAMHGLGSLIHLTGPLPQREVIASVQNAAVFAAPSIIADDGDRDGLPTVLLESMALGTAVIATDIVGIPEVVRHDETGLLVPQRNPVLLAEALHALLASPAAQCRLAQNARALIEREFDIHTNTQQMRMLFGAQVLPSMARAS